MADNIATKDRNDADIDIAAKDVAGVKFPRNVLTDPSGNDLTPLTDAALRATPVPISATELPLPSGAATQATLAALLAAAATDSTLATGIAALLTALGSPFQAGGAISNTSFGVSGTVDVSASSLPLPSGAATETTLAAVKIAAEAIAADPPTATLQGAIATLLGAIQTLITSLDGKTTAVNTGAVTVASSALPTGAATEATLAAQSGKLPASLGPKASAASVSVALATDSSSSNATSTAYEASRVIKAAAGTLWGLSGYNSRASGQFIQIHDAAALPAEGAVPSVLIYVAPQSSFSIDFGARGRAFSAGIVVCNSSTGPVKSIGSPDCWFDAQFS